MHDSCAVANIDVSSLMSDIKNELRWISLFRLFFMFVWSVSVWASVLLSSQCIDAWSAIETTHVHHQSSCLLLHFQVLLHVLSFNVTSAWFLEIECSYVQSELFADVSDLLLMSWFSLFSKKSDCHCIFYISFHDILDSLLLHLQDVSSSWLILSTHHDEWWLKLILSVSYLAFNSFSS